MSSRKSKIFLLSGIAIILFFSAALFFPSFKKDVSSRGFGDKHANTSRSPQITKSRENQTHSSDKKAIRPNAGSRTNANTGAQATLNEHGFLTSNIIELAGLSKEETKVVQGLLSEHRSSMSKLIERNMTADESRSDANLGIRAFVIKPFEAEGEREHSRLVSKLDSTIGESRRNIILQGSATTDFFSYGKNEALIRLFCGDAAGNLLAPNDDKTNIKTMTRAEVITYDANSGRSMGKSSCSLKTLTDAIGEIFPESDR